MVSIENRGPRIPVPAALRSNIPGTWAYDTMSGRIRTDILDRIFRENEFSPHVLTQLRKLDEELQEAAHTPLSPFPHDGGPDVDHWNSNILHDTIAKRETWLSAPWAVAEFYFYRRVMSAIGYFAEPFDPFTKQKTLGLSSSASAMESLASRVHSALQSHNPSSPDNLQRFVLTSLWGNRMDLSLWPVGVKKNPAVLEAEVDTRDPSVTDAPDKYIITDDSVRLCGFIATCSTSPMRYDIIVDNAGFELFCDLCLADYLVASGLASKVHIHLKAHPTFVSDAMAKDVAYTIDYLCRSDGPDVLQTLGKRWASHVAAGRWLLREDFFWAQPTPMWAMPDHIATDLSTSTVVFVKGDANYRRLLGDCAWPLDTPTADVLSYFPAPICALRTLKAELGCGMPRSVTDRIAATDPSWLVSGRYGVVQFVNPATD